MITQNTHDTFTSPDGAVKTFQLIPGRRYFFTVDVQPATVQFLKSDNYKTYAESDGTNDQGFVGYIPFSGMVRISTVTTGAKFTYQLLPE